MKSESLVKTEDVSNDVPEPETKRARTIKEEELAPDVNPASNDEEMAPGVTTAVPDAEITPCATDANNTDETAAGTVQELGTAKPIAPASGMNRVDTIKRQVEYYMSDNNLRRDAFFHELISSSHEGWIDFTSVFVLSEDEGVVVYGRRSFCRLSFVSFRGEKGWRHMDAPKKWPATRTRVARTA